MHRRTILRGVVAGVAAVFAGCVENGPADGSPDGTENDTTEPGDGSDGSADTPALADAALERRGDCSEPESTASVAFENETVTVDGCLEAADGCVYPELASAGYEDGAFVIAVEGVDESDPDEACTQAIEYRAYEVTATFDGGVPGTVEVRHDGEPVTEARPE